MNKKVFIIIGIIFFLHSCTCKCVKTHLTKEEKQWFSVYQKQQEIIFESNLGNLDTLVVVDKYEIYGNKDCNCREIGTIQNNMMNIDLKSKICHNDSYCVSSVSISKDEVSQKSFPSFNLFGLFYSGSHIKSLPQKTWVMLKTTKKKYTNVYIFEDGINAKNFGRGYLKSFYWDKKEGLLRYDTSEGEIFELLKK
ncbi:hypothetical protein [Flavobacterium chungbukense]|uniref:Lipoprotein n=1 Tax=Flavobacterium chungbukense TaxID=877464 RepID=A0ABP7XSJ1_9FLAO|nr:hypothetical protein [Flavobacterium chungbukense]MCC4921311.1 hypothetical protein [Flavobacterium chungbukense]